MRRLALPPSSHVPAAGGTANLLEGATMTAAVAIALYVVVALAEHWLAEHGF